MATTAQPVAVLVVGVSMFLLSVILCDLTAVAAGAGAPQTQLHVRIDLSNGDPGRAPMVALSPATSSDGPRVTWELPSSLKQQRWFALNVTAADDARVVYSTGVVHSADQNASLGGLRQLLDPATVYHVQIWATGPTSADDSADDAALGAGMVTVASVPQRFFTALTAWAATPMWSPPCGAGDAPEFAWFHGILAVPAGTRISSALAFVTAEGPLNIAPYNDFDIDLGEAFALFSASTVPRTRRMVCPALCPCWLGC